MMFKTYLISFLLAVSLSHASIAQNYARATDSLQQRLLQRLSPEEAVHTYYELCASLYHQELHDSVLVYADKGIALAQKHQLLFQEALLTEEKALSLEFIDIDRSIEVYLQALDAYKQAGKGDWIDEVKFEGVGNAHTILIRMFARKGEMDKAIHHYNIIEKIVKNDQYNTRKAMYESMGFAQAFSGNYPEAIRYFKTSIALGKEAEKAIGQPIRGMEENYSLLGSYFFKLGMPDSALHYLQEGRAIAQDSTRSRIRGRAMVFRISGEIYLGLNQLKQAKQFLSEALEIYQTVGDVAELSRTAANLAACYLKMQDYPLAIATAQQAYEMAVVSNDLPSIQQSLTELKAAYLATGESEKALATTLELLAVKDSIQGLQNSRLTEEFTKRYESREKQNQIDLQNAHIDQQRITIWATVLIASLLLAFAILVVWTARRQRQTNQILEQQKAQLQELDAAKTRFFANVSHELRTPLTLIIAPLENALTKVKNQIVRRDLELAQQNGKNLLQLVNEILDLSKLENDKLQLQQTDIPLIPTVKRLFFAYESLAKLQAVKLIFQHELDDTLWIKTDVNKLAKILNNLIANAIKYVAEDGKVILNVKQNAAQQLQIAVIDNGTGITAKDLPYVFDRYYQSGTAMQGGTGIGLALAKELSELMDGSLSVESTLGKGSTFILQLPLNKIPTPTQLPAMETLPQPITATENVYQPQLLNAEKATVLIVEDQPEMLQFLQRALRPFFNCETAANGKIALEKIERQRFDLITSDVMMPQMDGFEFLTKLRHRELHRRTPVLMLTARSLETDKLRGFQLGVDDYLTKPFSVNELLARMENLLANKKVRETEEETTAEPESHDTQFIKKLEQTVLDNLRQSNFKTADLAASVHYSQRQLERIIKRLTGFSPNRFIKEIRLQRARQLLETQQLNTVAEVGYTVGFADAAYFAKVYQKRFGVKPSEVIGNA